jgi:hypothetical protein
MHVWLIGLLLQSAVAPLPERSPPDSEVLAATTVHDTRSGAVAFVELTRHGLQRRDARQAAGHPEPWLDSLPAGLLEATSGDKPPAMSLALDAAGRPWLSVPARRLLWRHQPGAGWLAIEIGFDFASITPLAGGLLVAATPEDPEASFVLLDHDGRIRRRLARRLTPPDPALAPEANRWSVAATPDGGFLAFHQYRALLRRFHDGRLVDQEVATPGLADLEQRRLEAEQGLASLSPEARRTAELPRFAGPVFPGSELLGVSMAEQQLELFRWDGTWIGTRPLALAADQVPLAGWIASEQEAVLLFPSGPRKFSWQAAESLRGRVVSHNDQPVRDARVRFEPGPTPSIEAHSAPDGSFVLSGARRTDGGRLTVSATGFLEVVQHGVLGELLAQPLVLVPQPELCLVVANHLGSPIPNYRVEISAIRREGKTTRSVSGGREEISGAADGRSCRRLRVTPPFLLWVGAEGHASQELEVPRTTVEAGEDVSVELGPESRLHLVVSTERDEGRREPLAEVRLMLFGPGVGRLAKVLPDDRTAVSDEEGRAAFRGLAAGEYRLRAEASGMRPAEVDLALAEAEDAEHDITLRAGARVHFLVHEGGSGAPVPHVEVEVLPVGARCETDFAGRCTVEGLEAGRHRVRAASEQFLAQETRFAVARGEELTLPLEVRRGIRLTGEVLGVARYRSHGGLEVMVDAAGYAARRDRLDASGRFLVDSVPAGLVRVWVSAAGSQASLTSKELDLQGPDEAHVVLELPEPVALSGRVHRAGVGCGGCEVQVRRLGADVDAVPQRLSVALDGTFHAELTSRGTHEVEARDPASGGRRSELVEVDGAVEVELALGGHTLAGVVRGPRDPEGLGAAQLSLIDLEADRLVATTSSGPGGRFEITEVGPGRYRLVATAERASAAEEVDVRSDRLDLELRLEETTGRRLRLVDAASGEPLTDARFQLVGGSGRALPLAARADPSGTYLLPDPGEPLVAVVAAAGGVVKAIYGLSPDAELTVPLHRPGRAFFVETARQGCLLTVLDASGRPAALDVTAPLGPVRLGLESSLFNGLEPGSYEARWECPDGTQGQQAILLQPGSIPTVRF